MIYFGDFKKDSDEEFCIEYGCQTDYDVYYTFWINDSIPNPYLNDTNHTQLYLNIKNILDSLGKSLNFSIYESCENQICISFANKNTKIEQKEILTNIYDELIKNGCIYSKKLNLD